MQLHWVDVTIIAAYLGVTVLIGIWASTRASKDLDDYFLGRKTLPWYILGVSNASGMFDITGTMWMVYLYFAYRFFWGMFVGTLSALAVPWAVEGLWPGTNTLYAFA